nr:NBS-LRR type disease resistance protein [Ipomoea batatas]
MSSGVVDDIIRISGVRTALPSKTTQPILLLRSFGGGGWRGRRDMAECGNCGLVDSDEEDTTGEPTGMDGTIDDEGRVYTDSVVVKDNMAEKFVSAALNFSSNFRHFDKNMKALKRQVTLLSSQAEDIETTLMTMERGGKKKRKLEVKGWLEQVEEMKNEFETFNESITNGGLMEKVKFLEHVQTMRGAIKELRDDGRNIGELTVDLGKKTVLILDDVWKCIHLEKLGDPHKIEGCKFIITSRSLEVCRQIGCQKIFKVDIFNEKEAWNLFKQILLPYGHTVLSNAIEEHAKSLAKKCGGLPLALNTVAASMRGVNDDHIGGMPLRISKMLIFKWNTWKIIYCEIRKHEVIMKLIAEGLCEDSDEGHSILNKLVDVFLLEGREGYVKMHDLMREMGLRISKFMVKSDLIVIPEERQWISRLKRVSFMKNKIQEIPYGFSPRCHKLSTLILKGNNGNVRMKKLLPQGLLQNLKNLDTLSVEYCRQLEVVIGGVVEGEEGSSSNTSPLFSASNILYLPKLKHLQLKHLPELKSICNGREMICPSIEKISIWRCTNVKRMPSFLPINEATEQPSVPSSFRGIELHKDEKEWWESLELHNPNAKHILQSHIQW